MAVKMAFPRGADWTVKGMQLRDYFAAAALAGAIGDRTVFVKLVQGANPDLTVDLARACYTMADAMMAARGEESA